MSGAPVAVRARGLGYMPGIDGLRTVAVAAVVIYHLGASWLPGGYLGVDVFLVISGFLITSLLLAEHRATGRIDLRRFWLRRARRLLPAVLLMMAVVLAVMLVLHPDEVGRLRGQVLAALAYVINWHFVVADVPYFAQFGRPSVLLHLWSLAIEEQFYLIWPPLLVLALLVMRRHLILAVVVLAAAGSAVLAGVLWEPDTDPSRIYYGTDTRAVALLVGVALALAPAAVRGAGATAGSWRRRGLPAVGLVGAAGVMVAMLTLGDLDERLYRGGFLLVALATAGVVLAAADSSSPIGRFLGIAPLVWLGLRSYGIYLWHWPVIVLTRPDLDVPLDGAPLVALRLALTLAAAALSYRFVETPVRRHGLAGIREALRGGDRRIGRPARIAAVSSAALAVGALVVAVAFVPAHTVSVPGLTAGSAPAGEPVSRPATDDARGLPRLLFVGDSVMLGASGELRRAFGGRAVVDAAVGRRFPEGAAIVTARLKTLPPDTVVVLHLGNNYFIAPRELDALMASLAGRPRVALLTVRVPLRWQDPVNDAIRDTATRHPNVTVIDWHAQSAAPGLLVDGAHMNEAGMRVYSRTIRAALDEGPDPQ